MAGAITRTGQAAGAAGLALICIAAARPEQAYSTIVSLTAGGACACGLEAACSESAHRPKPAFAAAPGSPLKVGPMPGRPLVADFNNDGNPDLAVACGTCCGSTPSPDSGHVTVMLGDGAGSFRPAGERIVIGPSAIKVAAADADKDGRLDLFVIEHNTDDLHVLLGDGTGAFSPAPGSPFRHAGTSPGPRPHTHDVALGDVNADGNPDAVVTRCNDNRLGVLLGDGRGRFAPAPGSPLAAGRHPYEGLHLRDVTGDGRLDAVVTNLQGNTISVLTGDGAGGFVQTPGSPYAVGPRPGTLVLADLNADGRDDIAATHDDDPLLAILLADGRGGFTPAKGSPFTLDAQAWGIAAADFDADGSTDLAAVSWRGVVTLHRGDGGGGIRSETFTLPVGRGAGQLAVADLNNDGRADIVTGNYESGDLTVLLAK